MDTDLCASLNFSVVRSNNPIMFEGPSSRCSHELPPKLPIIQSGTYVSGPQRANNTDVSASAKAQTKIPAKASPAPALNRKKPFPRPALVQGRGGLGRILDDLYPGDTSFGKLDHGIYVRHRLAVYGATALHNRHKFRANAARVKAVRNGIDEPPAQSILEEEKCEILHFGITFQQSCFQTHLFEVIYKPGENGERGGCRIIVLEDGDMTDDGGLRILVDRYRAILDWAKTRYVDGLKEDIKLYLSR